MNKEKNRVNWYFDRQMSKNKPHTKAYKKSELDKILFNRSLQLSIEDWREIRGGEFWQEYDEIECNIEKHEFTLEKIDSYLNNK